MPDLPIRLVTCVPRSRARIPGKASSTRRASRPATCATWSTRPGSRTARACRCRPGRRKPARRPPPIRPRSACPRGSTEKETRAPGTSFRNESRRGRPRQRWSSSATRRSARRRSSRPGRPPRLPAATVHGAPWPTRTPVSPPAESPRIPGPRDHEACRHAAVSGRRWIHGALLLRARRLRRLPRDRRAVFSAAGGCSGITELLY